MSKQNWKDKDEEYSSREPLPITWKNSTILSKAMISSQFLFNRTAKFLINFAKFLINNKTLPQTGTSPGKMMG